MKAESNIMPENRYEIENITDGRCDVVFFENISREETEEIEKYTYDTYRLNLCYYDNIEEEVEDNYEMYLDIAKNNEKTQMGNEIRKCRNKLLNDTDWTQMPDSALSAAEIEKYRVYRQALRDIPSQENFPEEVIWPTL